MRLEGDPQSPRLMTIQSRRDLTGQMQAFCAAMVKDLERKDLSGFICKKGSPSSGLFRVPVYRENGAAGSGKGLFAAAVARHFPLLPMEDEARLSDPLIRENFIGRIFSYRRWRDFMASGPDYGRLVEFHTAHKLLLMAHSPGMYRTMGRLVGQCRELPLAELLQRYGELLMKGVALQATPKKNTNVLQHVMGYFKRQLSREEKGELLEAIERYRNGMEPLLVPLTLLVHYVRSYDQQYLKGQVYLFPPSAQLMLCNHP
jgi:uncharacterized protein YbgA (DUF1722 family)